MAGAYLTSVFIVVPVQDVVAAVFYAPVTAIGFEDLLCVGLLRCSTGDAVDGFGGDCTGFFIKPFAFNHEGLANMGEVEIVVELA